MASSLPLSSQPASPRRDSVSSAQSLVRTSQLSSMTTSLTTETPWTVSDVAKAGRVLLRPAAARDVEYDTEEEMRRVYTLLYDAFRYKSVLNEALTDTAFYYRFPECRPHERVVTLLFYDLYKRRFLPRDAHSELMKRELFQEAGIPEVDEVLWKCRVRLAAALSRIRIKNNALHLSKLLPVHLRDERVVPLEEAFVTGWINSFQTSESIPHLIERSGLRPVRQGQEYLEPRNYQFDAICPKFVLCHPDQRGTLIDSQLVREKKVILQDRSFCLGPALLSRILAEYELTGAVVQTHINTPRSVAYLANILADNDKIQKLLAFGAADKKEEYECYLRDMGVTNTQVFSERFVDLPSTSTLLEGVVGVLATPPNSYSGIANPVDLVCSRGGDMEMLEILTDLSGNTGCEERLAGILGGQRQTLRHSMAKPQIQVVVYVTHSVLATENDAMVAELISEMNQSAWDRHADVMLGIKTSSASQHTRGDVEDADTETEVKETTRLTLPPNVRVIVPLCDQFEIGAIPNVCMHVDSTMEEEGCFLALLQRKEIVRLDSKYMINIAEQRGLFGDGGATPAKKPRSHKKRSDKEDAAAAARAASSKKPRRKIEIDRIAAPTQASLQRQVARPSVDAVEGSTGSLVSARSGCARHQQHTAEDGIKDSVVFPCKHNHDSKQSATSTKRVHPATDAQCSYDTTSEQPFTASRKHDLDASESIVESEVIHLSWLEATKQKLQSGGLYKSWVDPETTLETPEPVSLPTTTTAAATDADKNDLGNIRVAFEAQAALIERLTTETQSSMLRNVKWNRSKVGPVLPYDLGRLTTECQHYIKKMRSHQGGNVANNSAAAPVMGYQFNLTLDLDVDKS